MLKQSHIPVETGRAVKDIATGIAEGEACRGGKRCGIIKQWPNNARNVPRGRSRIGVADDVHIRAGCGTVLYCASTSGVIAVNAVHDTKRSSGLIRNESGNLPSTEDCVQKSRIRKE